MVVAEQISLSKKLQGVVEHRKRPSEVHLVVAVAQRQQQCLIQRTEMIAGVVAVVERHEADAFAAEVW
jgi:hypothetical protein